MRRLRRLQLQYGLLWGALAFGIGWLATWYAIGEASIGELPRWQAASWLFLGANFVSVQINSGSLVAAPEIVNLVETRPEYSYLKVLPIGLSTMAGILQADTLGYTKRLQHLVENGVSITTGYATIGVVIMVVSNAQPTVEAIALAFLVFGGALFIGSFVINRLTGGLPIIGIATLGTILAIGVIVLLGGYVLVMTVAPLLLLPASGGIMGAGLLAIARHLD